MNKERYIKATERLLYLKGMRNIEHYTLDGFVTYTDEDDNLHICLIQDGWKMNYITPETADQLACIVASDLADDCPNMCICFDIVGFKVCSENRAMVKHAINVPVRDEEVL